MNKIINTDYHYSDQLSEKILDINKIFLEPSVMEYPRGLEILEKFPDAERIMVDSHWNIPGLHGNEGLASYWIKIKKTVLVLGTKKSISAMAYSRSSDFVAPSHASGCAMACSYCYVPRRKGFANPISIFVNIERIVKYLEKHTKKQGPKISNMVDDKSWVYELGSSSDCSVDSLISDNIKDLIDLFKRSENCKATFATKFVNKNMLNYDPQRKTRIRFSLMPQSLSKIVDIRTSPISERIKAINDFYEAGFEVNINFGPVIYTDNWLNLYKELFIEINDHLNDAVKKQLSAEVIFLTHNANLHQVNMQWHPKGEDLLWKPEIQENKISGTGGENIRYKLSVKGGFVRAFTDLLKEYMPYCKIRYAF